MLLKLLELSYYRRPLTILRDLVVITALLLSWRIQGHLLPYFGLTLDLLLNFP